MDRQMLEALEEQEREAQAMEAGSWYDLVRRDFANGEEVVPIMEEMLRRQTPKLRCLPLLYRTMRQRGEVVDRGAPVRTGSKFSLRKHATCFVAYFHSHDFYEMLYVCRGHLRQYAQGSRVPTVFSGGGLCLLAPGMVHALEPAGQEDLIFKIVIPGAMFEKIKTASPGTVRRLEKALEDGMIQILRSGGQMRSLMELLAREQLCEERPRTEVLQACLTLIFAEAAWMVQSPAVTGKLIVRIEEILDQADAGISLEELAKRLGYSPDYLGRRIRRESGESFTRLRQKFFLEKAAELLLESTLSVDEVAARLGYRSTSSFYRLFQKEYGIAPGAYRKMME